MTFRVNFATPFTFGWGELSNLPQYIPEGRTMLVLGRASARELELKNRLESILGRDLEVFEGIEPNPGSETIENGAQVIRDLDPEMVLAVGGGSVMDAAKFMAVIARHGGNCEDYAIGGKIPQNGGYDVYAVPTTPGTSSEITPFSVVSLKGVNNKVGFRHPSIFPKGALIDPELTLTLPSEQTAATGMDILSHAVESYWAVRSDPVTRECSLRSVSLVREHLVDAYKDGGSRTHREGISLASVFAGLAFSNTGTTICHSISYPITYDSGLPHGLAVALSLGATFDLLKSRGYRGLDKLAEAFGTTEENFDSSLKTMLMDLDSPLSLSEAGFKGGVERVMETDISPLLKNFPIPLKMKDIEKILMSIL